ncbi:MAG: hypothetical protein JSU96_14615, partial [Acidobacteriota bacterium]
PLYTDSDYGLRTSPLETVWKLEKIVEGHPQVFEALARWAAEHEVIFVIGNHDIELSYAEVQSALRECLAGFVSPEERSGLTENVTFCPWFFFDGQIYIEHGHQYDPLNAFRSPLDPALSTTGSCGYGIEPQTDLPIGSLFVRYLFNRIETGEPFADNVKPATRFLTWLITRHPIRAYRYLFTDGLSMLERLKRNWRRAQETADPTYSDCHQDRFRELRDRLSSTPDLGDRNWSQLLDQLDALREPSLMYRPKGFLWKALRALVGPVTIPILSLVPLVFAILGFTLTISPLLLALFPYSLRGLFEVVSATPYWWAFSESVRWVFLAEILIFLLIRYLAVRGSGSQPEKIRLREKAREIQRLLGAKAILMGHSHDTDLWRINRSSEYFNTGTWTKIFGAGDPLERAEKELTFALITPENTGLKVKLMKWEGESCEARLAYLFADPS